MKSSQPQVARYRQRLGAVDQRAQEVEHEDTADRDVRDVQNLHRFRIQSEERLYPKSREHVDAQTQNKELVRTVGLLAQSASMPSACRHP